MRVWAEMRTATGGGLTGNSLYATTAASMLPKTAVDECVTEVHTHFIDSLMMRDSGPAIALCTSDCVEFTGTKNTVGDPALLPDRYCLDDMKLKQSAVSARSTFRTTPARRALPPAPRCISLTTVSMAPLPPSPGSARATPAVLGTSTARPPVRWLARLWARMWPHAAPPPPPPPRPHPPPPPPRPHPHPPALRRARWSAALARWRFWRLRGSKRVRGLNDNMI